jgi:hypothetical protein
MGNAYAKSDLTSVASFHVYWKLSSVKQTPSREEVELEEYRRACAFTFSQNIDTMSW